MSALPPKADIESRADPCSMSTSVAQADCGGSLLACPFAFEEAAWAFQNAAKAPWMRYDFGAACNITNGGEPLSPQCPPLLHKWTFGRALGMSAKCHKRTSDYLIAGCAHQICEAC
jgi:hypothetical protein